MSRDAPLPHHSNAEAGDLGQTETPRSGRRAVRAMDFAVILIVDDNLSFRSALAALFGVEGFASHAIESPQQLDLADLVPPRLVVTDFEMPGEDGLSFAERVHERFPGTPVALVTANLSPIVEREVARRSWISLFHKPVDFSALLALVRDVTQVASRA